MRQINHLILSPRFPFFTVLLVGVAMVVCGVILAQLLRLAACPLCILQRMLYIVLALSAGLGLLVFKYPAGRRLAALLMTASAATGVFVAGYQTYIQRFAQDTVCSNQVAWWEALVDWAGEIAPRLFYASGLCSDPAWKFIGLSIAEWSMLAFSALTLLSFRALLRRE
ncbi:MAG: disulfide bond formation protein B [Betaproteobacteria bacterium]|nr:disulfide bond formation protein B [Betaproteobacteria bacterium]